MPNSVLNRFCVQIVNKLLNLRILLFLTVTYELILLHLKINKWHLHLLQVLLSSDYFYIFLYDKHDTENVTDQKFV